MNFDFSDDLKQLHDQARRFLAEQSPPKVVRHVLEGGERYAALPCLNDRPAGMRMLQTLIRRELAGWA